MATGLKCDNCPNFATERDQSLPHWWTVERFGATWIEPPGTPQMAPMAPPTIFIAGEGMGLPEEVEDAMIDGYLEESEGKDVDVTLHFCSAKCLAEWAVQAADFES